MGSEKYGTYFSSLLDESDDEFDAVSDDEPGGVGERCLLRCEPALFRPPLDDDDVRLL